MEIRVKALGFGETAADLADGRLILGEEGRVAVTISDSDGKMAVVVLDTDEADQLARSISTEAWKARLATAPAGRVRLRDLLRGRRA